MEKSGFATSIDFGPKLIAKKKTTGRKIGWKVEAEWEDVTQAGIRVNMHIQVTTEHPQRYVAMQMERRIFIYY